MKKNRFDRAFDQFISETKVRRRDDFEPYTEPFRPLNGEEILCISRITDSCSDWSGFLVSYQALPGGFTICNVIDFSGRLFSGCSHCIKSDRWLPIRGKMNAFRRALEHSKGIDLPVTHKGEVK